MLASCFLGPHGKSWQNTLLKVNTECLSRFPFTLNFLLAITFYVLLFVLKRDPPLFSLSLISLPLLLIPQSRLVLCTSFTSLSPDAAFLRLTAAQMSHHFLENSSKGTNNTNTKTFLKSSFFFNVLFFFFSVTFSEKSAYFPTFTDEYFKEEAEVTVKSPVLK